MTTQMETFRYDDAIVRKFAWMTIIWAIVGMLVGVILALQLAFGPANTSLPWLSFGRLRPLHTNAVIFAFAGNALFAGMYYSTQRLLRARMFSDALSKLHFWGWQLIIVAAAITLPLGITSGKEYAELEWPIDIAITLVWVAFAINFFGAIVKRREKHLYVAIWFYIATIISVALLHIVNSLGLPVSLFKSYSIYAGVQDALVQWWYGHNAVAFFLTTPFLGLMYYFMPKAAERPVYSYKLSIIHFWALVFLYIWAGPHHLLYTAIPEWAQTLGMAFSLMLIAPSWGGMLNGLLTLRGAWDKLRTDPVIKFFVVAITFYGVATFEGPMLAIKSLNLLSHYTDWTIAHVHGGALGWNGFMAFGMLYWLIPRLYGTKLHSDKLANAHFWMGLLGIATYTVSMWSAGITQGLMWFAFGEDGALAYPNFMETVTKLAPFYWLRLAGGTLYFTGVLIALYNLVKTAQAGSPLADTEASAPALTDDAHADATASWHTRLEGKPLLFTVLSLVAVLVGTLIEFVPMIAIESNVPSIAAVKPYTALELEGRDIYIREGCYNCHSQMIRPMRAETERYGEYSKAGEFVYDHPFQFGSRRIGPDLHRIGGKYPNLWHVNHMRDPRSTTPQSIMPNYPWLLEDDLDAGQIGDKLAAMRKIGVPYTDSEISGAQASLDAQAKTIADDLASNGVQGMQNKEITALIAYLQRLGKDATGKGDSVAAVADSPKNKGAR